MAIFKVYKETALPGTLTPHSIYFIAPASSSYVEIYVTDSAGTAHRHIPTESDINQMIIDAISNSSSTQIVNDITARDALTPSSPITVFVIDATDDATVASGGATYIYNINTTSWVKISEAESLDLSLTWASITGKPTSSTTDIDDAVSKKHTHTNKTQLDLIGQDTDGNLTYNGSNPFAALSSTGW
ncbi:MAG: hypothetical protein PHI79_03425 [Sulfurovaceae bacterium]|nr:hypothetical protein [Sulfurovaceae bacterium]MDD5548632.1 hypothetical protein [Sulfurovaceae bacterium]